MQNIKAHRGFIYIDYNECNFYSILKLIADCLRYLSEYSNGELTILLSGPFLGWNQLQATLNAMYQSGAQVGWEIGHPLLMVDIIVKELCNYEYNEVPDFEFNYNNRRYFPTSATITVELNSSNDKQGMINEGPSKIMLYKYSNVALGGTFDYLHSGHKILLTMAAYICTRRLVVGVTSYSQDRLAKKKYYTYMQPLGTRLCQVTQFLKKIKAGIKYEVVAIDDDYGPTRYDEQIDALVGSKETEKGCCKGYKI